MVTLWRNEKKKHTEIIFKIWFFAINYSLLLLENVILFMCVKFIHLTNFIIFSKSWVINWTRINLDDFFVIFKMFSNMILPFFSFWKINKLTVELLIFDKTHVLISFSFKNWFYLSPEILKKTNGNINIIQYAKC
jgi:hypothetical protein